MIIDPFAVTANTLCHSLGVMSSVLTKVEGVLEDNDRICLGRDDQSAKALRKALKEQAYLKAG